MARRAGSPDRSRTAAEPQWLDQRERAAWLALTGVLLRLPGALDSQLQRDSGLSYFDYMVLAVLSEAPDWTRPDEGPRSPRQRLALAAVARGVEARVPWGGLPVAAAGGPPGHRRVADRRWLRGRLQGAAPGHVAAVRAYVFDALTDRQVDQLKVIGVRLLDQVDPGGWRPEL